MWSRTALLAAVLSAFLAVPALAAELGPPMRIINPALLTLRRGEMPGFRPIRHRLLETTSPAAWTKALEQLGAAGTNEAQHLTDDGFQQGIMEFLRGSRRDEGVYNAMHFLDGAGAEAETAEDVSYDLSHYPRSILKRSTIRGVPGSVVFAGYLPSKRLAVANVLFSVHACSLIIADSVHNAGSLERGLRGPLAAARSVYRRLRHVC